MVPALEAIDDVGEARRALGEVRRVDLRDVAEADHLGAGTGARDERLHLLGREVLRLVDDEVLVDEGAPAHEVQALHLDAVAYEVRSGGAAPVACLVVGAHEDVEVVLERSHPRRHLLFLGAGQEADVLAHRDRDARHDDLGVDLELERLHEARGEREQRLAGARLAQQRHEVDLRIHQQVQREVLLAVARGDAPDVVLVVREVLQRLQERGLAARFLHDREERPVALVVHELVHQHRGHQRALHAVHRLAVVLPALDVLAVPVPEILRQRHHPRVEEVGVLEDLVVEVVLGGQPDRVRLDAHVDVFRHQHHVALRILLLEVERHAEDHVVGLLLDAHGMRLQEEVAGGLSAALRLERIALLDVAAFLRDDLVQEAARLPGVARDLAHALLVVV